MADANSAANSGSGSQPAALSTHEALGHYIEMWKASVEVQKHFNDIEWRIRGLALTVATFALGAAGIAAKDGSKIGPISLGTAVLILGAILWYAFYFVDRFWYHPLLKAAVAEGTAFEEAIRQHLPEAHMTAGITERSPQVVNPLVATLAGPSGTDRTSGKPVMHSEHKLRWFYRVGASTFIIGALALQLGPWLTQVSAPPTTPSITPASASPSMPTPSPAPTGSPR